MTPDGSFFDITHTFKVGPSTYHVLGLRKDLPTYRNTYYIFNCTGDEHESTNESMSKSVSFKRNARQSEQTSGSNRRPRTAHHTTTSSTDHFPIVQASKRKSVSIHPPTRTESPSKVEIDTTTMKETFTKIMKDERRLLVASLRKEMNVKKKAIIRSIKKEKEVLLQATTEANNKSEIIHLLEEQTNSITKLCETNINTTTSSIDTLKQTLIETLDTQHNTSQSLEQLQLTLIQAIEQEVQKITLKNEEILSATIAETKAIGQLQNRLIQKIENYPTTLKHDDEVLNHLFAEQKQFLTDAVAQQQTLSLERIKRTVLDAIDEKQSTPAIASNNIIHSHHTINDTITDVSSDQLLVDNYNITTKGNSRSLPKGSSRRLTDQNLFKVSIRSPEPAHIFAKLVIDGMECSRRLHTLCQQDAIQNDVFNCYIAPPTKNGPYEVTIYAKTNKETAYRSAICIRLPGSNISQSITFPLVHQSFEEHRCILIEPFQRLLRQNEQVLIHMIVPGAHLVRIQNGEDNNELDEKEYKNGIVKKKIRVRGDVTVTGCWDKKTDSTICVFKMM
jgi:hypothetical protein